jgi:hypothetical protein
MELANIINQFYDAFMTKYADTLLPSHLKALNSIRRCRTPDSGEVFVRCTDCGQAEWRPMSCGHRSCPKCQNHEASQWIDRQQTKLLPVPYFMASFTLPHELRPLAWHHQKEVFSIFFSCTASTLNDFALNPKNLGAEIGMSMVLHTHSRKLDYHPHIHAVLPGGGVDNRTRQWKKKKGKYLFNKKNLAKVFRARFLEALNEAGFSTPKRVPKKWIVDCSHMGKGITAMKYLSRYLYRGVISEKNIVSNQDGQVTFKYTESRTKKTRYRSLNGEDFLHLIMQHVLPKGFRRVRDYGFLHSNAKKTLSLVQLVLQVVIEGIIQRPRPVFKCSCCQSPMVIMAFRRPAWKSG